MLSSLSIAEGQHQKYYDIPIVTEQNYCQIRNFDLLKNQSHQQYLEKGGQSAKKDTNVKIRCYE